MSMLNSFVEVLSQFAMHVEFIDVIYACLDLVDQLLPNLDAITFYTMAIYMPNFSLDISSKYLVVEECIGNFVFLLYAGHKFQCNARKLVEYLQSNFLNVGAMIFQNTQLPCMCMHEIASRYHIAEHVSCMFCFA